MAQTFASIADSIKETLLLLVPILFILATIVFIWGIILYITSGGNEERRKEGRNFIIYGLIGLFVMVAVWGLVVVIADIFFPGGIPGPPGFPDLPGT
jgi:hypothetical protein